jgi:SNF2 family DNA or RNA helicase
VKYWSDKHFIYISGNTYPRRDYIKETLSGVWFDNKKGKGYRFPKNVFTYRELWKAFPELQSNTEFIEDGKLTKTDMEYWIGKKEFGAMLDYGLRPYQNDDIAYLKSRGSSLVLNEPRTGKTPTMIKVMAALNKRRNIVICPSSLVLNWAKEFKQWYPEIEVYAINGTFGKRVKLYVDYMNKTHKGKKCVLIISKDTWKNDLPKVDIFDDVKPFDVAIVDEAHFLRNWKSAQSKAIFELKANIKYALTGTPAVKHGSDVYGLLHFINPDAFPSYWQFTDRYWNILDNGWGKDLGGAKGFREKELLALMNINSVQRKRKDVMKWLPDQTRQTIAVELEKKQLKLYDQMFDTFIATDSEGDTLHEVDTMNKLNQLLRLRQLCLDPRLLDFDVVGAKTTALLDFADGMKEPFVVMTMFSSYFDLVIPDLEKLGKRVSVIDGKVPKQVRTQIVEQFQRGEIDILLANIIAAGTGLTLDRADTIVFVDKAFNPADNEQAEDRIVPTTKERYHPINIISFIADGTVDERINEILERKEDVTKLINKPEVFT